MNFRFVRSDDAELLAQLRINMRRERETAPPPENEEAFLQANVEFFRKAVSDGSYVGIIAEENGVPAGTGGICLHIHPPSYSVPNGKSACLLNMYTCPEFRGQGIAGKILAALVAKAREEDCCKVFLNASDMGKPLYQKFG
ncbi:MAG: GNAT family N-acetyltransferase, partial [Lentisphaeria bacterium]|nr:GNAT family N-acetyltransferase [Lentisphaeria bacterium]